MWSGKTWKAVHWVWTLHLKQEQKIKIILITLKPYHYFFHCVDIDCDVVKPTVNKAAGASAQIKMVEAKCRDITYWILQHSLSIIVDFGTYLSLWCHYTQNTRSSSAAPWAKNAGCFKGKPCCMVVWTLSFARNTFYLKQELWWYSYLELGTLHTFSGRFIWSFEENDWWCFYRSVRNTWASKGKPNVLLSRHYLVCCGNLTASQADNFWRVRWGWHWMGCRGCWINDVRQGKCDSVNFFFSYDQCML